MVFETVCREMFVKRLAVGSAIVALIAGAAVVWFQTTLGSRPEMARYARYELPPAAVDEPGSVVTVTWLGVATLLIDDGRTALMTDGFFSRPSPVASFLFGGVEPDVEAIEQGLARAGVEELSAVLVVHSHYDHSMDAPEVARRTGAFLVGSESTANVGRGWKLPESYILVPEPGRPIVFGDFTVTFYPSRHVELPFGMGRIGATIDAPLVPPARLFDYAEGGSWSIVVEHPLGRFLVQGSAGFVAGTLDDVRVDTVLLGVGNLGSQPPVYRRRYFEEIVEATHATRVIPIHFDDFAEPSRNPPLVSPRYAGDFDVVMDDLIRWTQPGSGRSLALLEPGVPAVFFRR